MFCDISVISASALDSWSPKAYSFGSTVRVCLIGYTVFNVLRRIAQSIPNIGFGIVLAMVASNWTKFTLVLWKNWRIQCRHKVQVVFEFAIPILCMLVLVMLRIVVNVEDYNSHLLFEPVSIKTLDPLRYLYQ